VLGVGVEFGLEELLLLFLERPGLLLGLLEQVVLVLVLRRQVASLDLRQASLPGRATSSRGAA
jgi:hypothetical protein